MASQWSVSLWYKIMSVKWTIDEVVSCHYCVSLATCLFTTWLMFIGFWTLYLLCLLGFRFWTGNLHICWLGLYSDFLLRFGQCFLRFYQLFHHQVNNSLINILPSETIVRIYLHSIIICFSFHSMAPRMMCSSSLNEDD